MAETEQPVNIAIIGGGFCGMVTAIHLLRHKKTGIHVHIINKGAAFGRGIAYDPHSGGLLLNVPNGRMSAFADRPDDYVKWLQQNYPEQDNSPSSFTPRNQYGEYLNEIWDEAVTNIPLCNAVTVYNDMSDGIVEQGGLMRVQLRSQIAIMADVVVLATGNAKPRLPNGICSSFAKSKSYFANPWKKGCIENTDGDILLIGNGLTAADTIVGLTENGFQQTIYSISPHGYRLEPWVEDKVPYTGFNFADLPADSISLHLVLKTFNRHRRIANNLNQSVYPIIDSLRPHIQKLWLGFSLPEKQRFIRYLKPYWEKVRHRLPVDMCKKISALRTNCQFKPYKGFIVSVNEKGDGIDAVLNCDGELKTIFVKRVVNCTGPDPDVRQQENPLLNNLIQNGLITPGPCGIGINADQKTGRVISQEGVCMPNLYAIGSSLKGVLWESTAVPELRVQAQHVAQQIITRISAKQRAIVETV